MSDLRHYDPSVRAALDLLVHANEWENYVARQGVNVENMARMGIDVARVVRRRSREMVVAEKERDRARKKARVLLRRHITKEQWEEFRKMKAFHVTGTDGRLYRVHHQVGSNVTLIVDGADVARYCVVPKDNAWIPEPDMMLAVKLMLETNAKRFLRTANVMELQRAG